MSADATLAAACQKWRALAKTEGDAIRAGDWNLVATCQSALAELQSHITHLRGDAQAGEAQTGTNEPPRDPWLQKVVSELIDLEQHNLSSLVNARTELKRQFNDLDQSCLNLKRIQRSYSTARHAGWNSYS
jgi:hypothetical protein